MIPCGQGLPSRNVGLLSWLNTSNTGGPNPVQEDTMAPDAFTWSACASVTQSKCGVWISLRPPRDTAADMLAGLTAWICTGKPIFAASSSATARLCVSFSVGGAGGGFCG